MVWARHIAYMGNMNSKLQGKRQLGRPRHRWDNIKRYLKEIDVD
jgi:hypothetical protein